MNEMQKHVTSIQQSALNDPRFKQHVDVEVTPEVKDFTNRLIKSILPHFPAWRQSCPNQDDLGRLKNAWAKAIMRNQIKTGRVLNVKAGLLACEESESDWMPSVGKFISMCEQNDDVAEYAKRALALFNSAQKQIDSVGQMVVSKHSFDLKRLPADKTEKQFIELYLSYAQDNAIESLDAFALTETVQLSPEQLKEAEKRTEAARNEFFGKFDRFITQNPNITPEVATKAIEEHHGIKQGSLKQHAKTPAQLEQEKQRQLAMIKGLEK